MILQALKEYYDRKAADPESHMAPAGWEWKEIPYILVLDRTGSPVSIQCTIEGSGKQKRTKRFLVPKGIKKANGIAANLLWENPEYALGAVSAEGKADRVAQQHIQFKKRLEELGPTKDAGLMAVRAFMSRDDKIALLERLGPTYAQLIEERANISFQLLGEALIVAETRAIKAALQENTAGRTLEGSFCLISGEQDTTARLHSSIKGVWDAQPSGANIVSFNLAAFTSYGKEQGANAPIGERAAFAYTEALNHLLRKDSPQRIQVGDASTIFWAEKEHPLENQFVNFFGEPPKDDPDRNVRAIESLFSSPKVGALQTQESDNRFYVLGLAPNASRISIRFWMCDTVAGMSAKLRQHFDDLKIIHGPRDRDVFPLFRLLVSTATLGKADNIPPALAGETMRAILSGTAYPDTLLQGVIRRIRAEHEITHIRAALIKGYLNRRTRLNNTHSEKEITMSLDPTNTNIGYRLGRLFATLEKIQTEASPGLNATIRDKFYGAASGTPVTVFGNLMRLKNHHLAKLENQGRRVNLERIIGEIVSGVTDFPAHLTLADQGRFAIGYYHQTQDFFTKKPDKE